MHKYRIRKCAFALMVFLLSLFEVIPVKSLEPWSLKYTEKVQMNVPKRTKDTKQSDKIRVNDIRPEEVKEVAFSEGYSESHSHKYSKPEGPDKYRRYNTYGKDDYEKYHKKDKYDHSKYDKQQYKKPKYDVCKHEKKHRHQCTAFFITATSSADALILKSVNGDALTLASTHIPEDVVVMSIFSNKARGSSCCGNDLEVVYHYSNGSQSAARFVYQIDSAILVYETFLTEEALVIPWTPLVTDIKILKGMLKVDAFNFPSVIGGISAQDPFRQFNLNSKSGALISTDLQTGICSDIYFFSEQCTRWLCLGRNPEPTSYLRDPSTGAIYIPPPDNDPARFIDAVNVVGLWGTAGTLCDKYYMAGITTAIVANTNLVKFEFMRAKVMITYPYFKKPEIFYQIEFSSTGTSAFMLSPPDTDVAFACSAQRFWRFDKVYTAAAPITPTVEIVANWDQCYQIISFTECTDEVYVSGSDTLWYSNNGGRSFAAVDGSAFPSIIASNGLTGFEYEKYDKSDKYEEY